MTHFANNSREAANTAVLARLARVRPVWSGVHPARDALGLPDFTLLHAGPPYADPTDPPAPILSSAVLCCLYEGWASGEAQAEALIASGQVTLAPAQSCGAVTPLAAVISPSTALVEVEDLGMPAAPRKAWSLLGSGAGPQIRFGGRDPAILDRMRWRDTVLAPHLSTLLSGSPVDLGSIADAGLAGGDDLHARTTAANAELRAILKPWPEKLDEIGVEVDAMLGNTPLFFLTLWMAACHLALDVAAADGTDAGSTLLVALAGNGRDCGIRIAGRPREWFASAAWAPAGPRLDPSSTDTAAAMTGDSGMIDAAGFGMHALAGAKEVELALAAWLPPDWRRLPDLHLARAPASSNGPAWSMLDAASIVASGRPAHALIAMIDAAGRRGLLGRGVVINPLSPFEAACAAVDEGSPQHG